VSGDALLGQDRTMEKIESLLVYDDLPISSGGAHTLRRMSASAALEAWLQFLEARSVVDGVKAYFDFPQTPDLRVEPRTVRLIEGVFGKSAMRLTTRLLRQPPTAIDVPPDRFDDAIELFESLNPLPTNEWGMAPVWLWFTADLKLRSMSGGVIPGQDPELFGRFQTPSGILLGQSSARLILQARISLGLTLSVPNTSDDELRAMVPWLEEKLPMRLSTKQWTRWTVTRSGNSYRGRKVGLS
jgi:hypothetical protein